MKTIDFGEYDPNDPQILMIKGMMSKQESIDQSRYPS